MNKLIQIAIFTVFVNLLCAQAKLNVENNSQRYMVVKVMKFIGFNEYDLYKIIEIGPNEISTVYFSQTGKYFTKTKASLSGRDPIYQKGQPFDVVNDETGYSEITITFIIKESVVPQVLGGKQITRTEFEND